MTKSSPRRTTVVVISWNTVDLLRSCLRTLAPLVDRGDIELVVVDNASSDTSAEMVANEFPGIARLIHSGGNIGFGAAANLGAQSIRTEWIAVSNADVEVPENALARLLEAGDREASIGLVAPRLDYPSGERQESVFTFPRLSVTLLAALGAHRLGSRIESRMFRGPRWDPEACAVVEWAMGAFVLIRRSAFDEIGGFAADQWMYAEDLDLGWRLRRHGWQCLYVPSARVVHVRGAAASDAFGSATSTPEVVGAYYHWLRTRRGAAWMWSFALVTLAGLGVRIGLYILLAIHPRRRASGAAARNWFQVNLRAALGAKAGAPGQAAHLSADAHGSRHHRA